MGFPVTYSTPAHNSQIYFDIREAENGAFVLATEPLTAEVAEFSFSSGNNDGDYFYGQKSYTGVTANGNLKSQRYSKIRVTTSMGHKSSSSSSSSTDTTDQTFNLLKDGTISNVSVGIHGITDLSIDANGNISFKSGYSKYWAYLVVNIYGVY